MPGLLVQPSNHVPIVARYFKNRQRVSQMPLHRSQMKPKPARDFPLIRACAVLCENVPLAPRQCLQQPSEFGFTPPARISDWRRQLALHCQLDRFQKLIRGERLVEEVHGPGAQASHDGARIDEFADANDCQIGVEAAQPLYGGHAAKPREPHVENDTASR